MRSPREATSPEHHHSALEEEKFRVLASPRFPSLAVFADDDAEMHAGALVAILTGFTQLEHARPQFIARGRRRRRTPLRCFYLEPARAETNALCERIIAQSKQQQRARDERQWHR